MVDDSKSDHIKADAAVEARGLTAQTGDASGLQDKLVAESQSKPGENIGQTRGGESARFLPSFDLEGASAQWGDASQSKSTGEGGWTARYAANFDQPGDPANPSQHLDMAAILGLPQGASHEDLVKTASKQEDELLQQLINA